MALTVSTLDIVPEDRADSPPCPVALSEWFADPRLHYILLDAGRLEALTGQESVRDFVPGLRCKSLFRDEALAGVAPWLIELARDDPDSDDAVAAFFDTAYNRRAGILLRSAAPFDRLFSHLRTFVMVRHATRDTELFFRFWDPLVAGTWFPGIATRPERVQRLMLTAEGVPVDFLVEDEPGTALVISPDAPPEPPRPAPGAPVEARPQMVLDAADAALLNEVAFKAMVLQLETWMKDAFADRLAPLSTEKRRAAARHVVDVGRTLGFRLKDEFSYLAHIMVHFGGWVHESGAVPAFDAILADRTAENRHRALQDAFAAAWDSAPRGALLRQWPEVDARLAGLEPAQRITPEVLKPLVRELLADYGTAVQTVVNAARPVAQAARLEIAEEGQHLFLSLALGHRYHEDPLRAWAGLPLREAMVQAWQSLFSDG